MSRAAIKFRRHVIALDPGSPIDWRDMDAWAKANCPESRLRKPCDPRGWAYEPGCYQPWDDLCIECMGICRKMATDGWLVKNDPEPIDYFPDANSARRASFGIDCQLMPRQRPRARRALGIGGQSRPILEFPL